MCCRDISAQQSFPIAEIEQGADLSGFDDPLRVAGILQDCAVPPLVLPLTSELGAMPAYEAPYELKSAHIAKRGLLESYSCS